MFLQYTVFYRLNYYELYKNINVQKSTDEYFTFQEFILYLYI